MTHAFPKEWTTTTLGDLAEIVMGTSPPGADVGEEPNGLPFIQGNGEFGVRHPAPRFWCQHPPRRAELGDLLVSVRAPVGALNEATEAIGIGRGIAAVRVDPSNRSFLWHLLSRELRQLDRVAQGSTFTAVNREDLEEIELTLPRPAERARIAEVLSAVDESIDRARAVETQTRTVRQALLDTLLSRGLPGRHTKFKTARPHGRVPTAWTACRLRDLDPFVTSGSRGWAKFYVDQGAVFLRIGNLTREHVNLDLNEVQRVQPPEAAEARRTQTSPGDVLISVTADLGIIGIVPDGLSPSYVSQHIALVRFAKSAKGVNPAWVANFLAGRSGQEQFKRLSDRGAKAGLNLPNVLGLHVLLPPKGEQDEAMRVIASEARRLDAVQSHLAALVSMKLALATALLDGSIRVSAMRPSVAADHNVGTWRPRRTK